MFFPQKDKYAIEYVTMNDMNKFVENACGEIQQKINR